MIEFLRDKLKLRLSDLVGREATIAREQFPGMGRKGQLLVTIVKVDGCQERITENTWVRIEASNAPGSETSAQLIYLKLIPATVDEIPLFRAYIESHYDEKILAYQNMKMDKLNELDKLEKYAAETGNRAISQTGMMVKELYDKIKTSSETEGLRAIMDIVKPISQRETKKPHCPRPTELVMDDIEIQVN